jgi:transitional endoplasmic reticulum ATPase
MKDAIRADVDHFYDSRETYENLKIPWKRGIIYYGPPGKIQTNETYKHKPKNLTS